MCRGLAALQETMSKQQGRAAPDADRLQRPLARLMRPLVFLLIKSGITFPALCDLLRELYVNVAELDFALAGKEQTDSRVSLLTGIHRKEVARLRGAGAPVSVVPVAVSRTSRILARWSSDPRFTDAEGHPKPLPRVGATESFEALVGSVTRDLRPRAVLDEWLDRGLVMTDADDCVVLSDSAFLPSSGSDAQLYYFGRNLHDHVAAAVANVVGDEPAFMERAVHYDGLSADVAADLERSSRALAMNALKAANRNADKACATDVGGRWRWNFGIYVYREEEHPAVGTEGVPGSGDP